MAKLQGSLQQGIPESKIFFVGNTMIDTLKAFSDKLIEPEIWKKRKLLIGKMRFGQVKKLIEIRLEAMHRNYVRVFPCFTQYQ